MNRLLVTKVCVAIVLGCVVCIPLLTAEAQSDSVKAVPQKVQAKEITWLEYDAGIAKALKEDKHVLIDFYTTWCGWCKKMDRSTFQDKKVVEYLEKNMVAIKVNAESPKPVTHDDKPLTERTLARDVYGARGYPTYFFLTPQGKALFKIPGYKSAADFIDVLEYVGDGHYEKSSFASFVEAKKGTKNPSKP